MLEAKKIKGHGAGTNMGWLCVRNVKEGFGFGDEPAIICIDMTVHAPEHGRPNTIFSTYENPNISTDMMQVKFHPNAYNSWEQVALAKRIVSHWNKIKSGETIEIVENMDDRWRFE